MGTADKVRAAYDYLVLQNGRVVTAEQIAAAAGWKPATARTYVSKLWAGVLRPHGAGSYEVQIPDSLDWDAFQELHSQVVLPPLVPTPVEKEYDVALSFAGEDRPYASQVAEILRAYGVRIFYDVYEQHSLWGKDLYAHLDEVYRIRSRYCVMFLSRHYREKLWTNHERKSAQARAFQESDDYLLPVRLDATEIPGVRPTIGYLDGRKLTPTAVSNLICAKLGINTDLAEIIAEFAERLPGYKATQEGTDLVFYSADEDYTVTLSITMLREAWRAGQLYLFTESSIFVQ
jgi:TIR domain